MPAHIKIVLTQLSMYIDIFMERYAIICWHSLHVLQALLTPLAPSPHSGKA